MQDTKTTGGLNLGAEPVEFHSAGTAGAGWSITAVIIVDMNDNIHPINRLNV